MWALEDSRGGSVERGPGRPSAVLVRRRPARAVVLAGGLSATLALVPLFVAPEPGPARLLSFVVLLVCGGAFVFLGWSRPERVELVNKEGGITWGAEPLPPPAYVALGGDSTEEPPAYRAFVGWSDGRERVALERDEPAGVLRDAMALATRLGLDLRPGWGLERHFPSELSASWRAAVEHPPESAATPTAAAELPFWPLQRRAAAITFAAGVFVLVVTAALIKSPDRSVGPSALSLALPTFAAGITLAIGAFLLGVRRRIELGPRGIESTSVLFGFPLGKKTALGPPPARAFGVAPNRGPVRHLVFATSAGPVAVAADPDAAERLSLRSPRPSAPKKSADEPARYFSTLPRS